MHYIFRKSWIQIGKKQLGFTNLQDKLENYRYGYYLVITYDIMFPIIKGCWHVGQRSICCSTWQCSSKSLSMLSPFLAFCKSHGLTNESKQKMSHSYIPWMSHVVLVLIELLCKFWIRYGNQWIEIACENPKMKKNMLRTFQQRNPFEQILLNRTIHSNKFSKTILSDLLLEVSSTST